MANERKLEMRDPKNSRTFPDQDSIDKFIEVAKQDHKREMFFYRERIGYNNYLIRMYAHHPSNEKEQAEVLYEISGVTRQEMAKMAIFPEGKPIKPVIKNGQPVSSGDLKPVDTEPT